MQVPFYLRSFFQRDDALRGFAVRGWGDADFAQGELPRGGVAHMGMVFTGAARAEGGIYLAEAADFIGAGKVQPDGAGILFGRKPTKIVQIGQDALGIDAENGLCPFKRSEPLRRKIYCKCAECTQKTTSLCCFLRII